MLNLNFNKMKKTKLILLLFLSFTIICKASITISPANLNGVHDTLYCQHAYSKTFTASGGTAPYKYTILNAPAGLSLNINTGELSGVVGFISPTAGSFTIYVSDKKGVTGNKTYTYYVRSIILTRAQLSQIWSRSNPPPYSQVFDTYQNTLSLVTDAPKIDTLNFWNINGNVVSTDTKKIGTVTNNDFLLRTNNITRVKFQKNGKINFTADSIFLNSSLTITPDGSVFNYGKSNVVTNTAYGDHSLINNTTGNINTSYGGYSLAGTTTGVQNTAVGYETMLSNTTGSANIAIGYQALRASNADINIAIGRQSLLKTTSGIHNVTIGDQTGHENTTGSDNTFIGHETGYQNLGSYNSLIGSQTGKNNTSYYNTMIGYGAGISNVTGYSNIFIGYRSAEFETDTLRFMVDAVIRSNKADARIKAPIVGKMDADPNNQSIYLNCAKIGMLYVPAFTDNSAAIIGGVLPGELYYTDSTGEYILKIAH